MAIYTKGTISADASGVVTGVGTKWRDALSLIRVGATLVNLSPMKFYTISSIVSDTELHTLNGDGVAVPAGSNYVILLHDSITVDGLAQDVAETLRYYQSSEAEIAQFLEIIKDFDWDRFEQIENTTVAAAATATQASTDAQQARTDTQQARTDTAQLKADTNTIKTETNQIKTDTQAIKTAADQAKADAVTAKGQSEAARDLSKQYADSINPSLLLAKANNLSDLQSAATARVNLGLRDASTMSVGTTTGTVAAGDDSRIDGALQRGSNLSDLSDPAAARFNISAITTGDYGLGYNVGSFNPITPACNQFISNANSTTWSPSNGAGIQSVYSVNRIAQVWVDSVGGMYARFIAASDPMAPVGNVPWKTVQMAGTSDINFKEVTGDLDTEKALSNIGKMEFKTFYYLSDEDKKERRGVIAQQIAEIDKQYTHSAEKSGIMTLDANPLLMDALAAIQELSKQVKDLKAEIAELKK